jgi:hypothetical protein
MSNLFNRNTAKQQQKTNKHGNQRGVFVENDYILQVGRAIGGIPLDDLVGHTR